MKKKFSKLTKMVFLVVVLASLLSPAQVLATWYWTHSHSGQVEYPDRVEMSPAGTPSVQASGLIIQQAPGSWNWVHFAVPTLGDPDYQVRYIKLKFKIDPCWDPDTRVTDVHIYDGDVKVKEFAYSPGAVGWGCGSNELNLDLGSARTFSFGLGVSVKVNIGFNGGYDRIAFSSVGADFQLKTTVKSASKFYVIPVVPKK